MLKTFKYTSKGETRERTVAVIHENGTAFAGIDLGYLDEDQRTAVKKMFENRPAHDFPAKGAEKLAIEGYDPAWNKAWRRFNVSSVVTD